MALLASISAHSILGYLLFTQTFKVPKHESGNSLKTYIIPVEQQREILANMQKKNNKHALKPEIVKDKQQIAAQESNNTSLPLKTLTIELEKVPAEIQKPNKQILKERQQVPKNYDAGKVLNFNPHSSIQTIIEKEERLFVQSQRFNHQVSKPRQAIKPSQKYQDITAIGSEVVSGNAISPKKIIKWRGKCYLVDDTSEIASAGLPSSSGSPCHGEKSDNQILLQKSLDKYLKN